jgi:uncharacterized protein YuzE
MDEADLRMAVDPFSVLDDVAKKAGGHIRGRVVGVDYDEEADVLYVQFKHDEGVDNEALDEEGYVIGKLNRSGEVVGLTIIDASRYGKRDS